MTDAEVWTTPAALHAGSHEGRPSMSISSVGVTNLFFSSDLRFIDQNLLFFGKATAVLFASKAPQIHCSCKRHHVRILVFSAFHLLRILAQGIHLLLGAQLSITREMDLLRPAKIFS